MDELDDTEAGRRPGTGAHPMSDWDATADNPTPMANLVLPQHNTVGRYRLLERIGVGGHAEVWRAQHEDTEQIVALKLIDPSGSQDDDYEALFREASATAGVRHPNVISCFAIGEQDGRIFMAMELVEGGDLRSLVAARGGRIQASEAVRLVAGCMRGLAAIHNAGFVHRDIKPQNVFITGEGTPKLADLGLASKAGGTGLDAIANVGTPAFMSPEQAEGSRGLDGRSDIYSMGATLFYMLSGQPPFPGDDPMDVISRVLHEPTPDVCDVVPALPKDIALVLQCAMAKQRSQRYRGARDFLEDLEALIEGNKPLVAHRSRDLGVVKSQHRHLGDVIHADSSWRSIVIASVLTAAATIVAVLGATAVGMWMSADGSRSTVEAFPDDGLAVLPASAGLTLRERGVSPAQQGGHAELSPLSWLQLPDARSINAALARSGDFTIELDLRAAVDDARGPARIFSLSNGPLRRNLTIGQIGDRIELRVRSTVTSPNGLRPHLLSSAGLLSGERQHVVLLREGERERLIVDGEQRAAAIVPGSLEWNLDSPLQLGAESDGSYSWTGTLYGVRVYDRALDSEEIDRRVIAWRQRSRTGGIAKR